MARTSAGESALSRAVRTLDAFDSKSVYLTATEIAKRTNQPLSSTHRQLQELTRLGLLDRSDDRSYRLGLKLWEWAARSPGAAGLRGAAMPHLNKLHSAVQQHAQIGVLSGNSVLFIERLSAPDSIVNYTAVGQRLPALASSSGIVQVALLPQDERESIIEAGVKQLTPATITDPHELRKRLTQIRRQGFAVGSGFIHPAARGIAVPIRSSSGDVLGAVSVIVPNDQTPAADYIARLKATAAAISSSYTQQTQGRG